MVSHALSDTQAGDGGLGLDMRGFLDLARVQMGTSHDDIDYLKMKIVPESIYKIRL